MKEFDFDELDRAVNSALSATPVAAPSTPADETAAELSKETVINLDGATTTNALVEPVKKPEQTPEGLVEAAKPAQPTSTAPLAARRSSGRFMDMVHSSSDMRTGARPANAAPAPAASLMPLPLSPLKSADTDESNGATYVEPTINETPGGPAEEDTEPALVPLESPFLPDAKVEKRPLGGPAVAEPAAVKQAEVTSEALPVSDFPDPIDFHTNQTNEPNADTPEEKTVADSVDTAEVAVEGQAIETAEAIISVQETAPTETLLDDIAAQKVDAELIDIDAAVEPETYGPPASITQQYKEQPSTATESGAIYDTESYHQPLTPAVKKRSGVWTIGLILLLVIIGAGLGAAFYIYILPML